MSLSIKHVVRNPSTGQYFDGIGFGSYRFVKHYNSEEIARNKVNQGKTISNFIIEKVYIKE